VNTYGVELNIKMMAYVEVEAENEEDAELKATMNCTSDNFGEWTVENMNSIEVLTEEDEE